MFSLSSRLLCLFPFLLFLLLMFMLHGVLFTFLFFFLNVIWRLIAHRSWISRLRHSVSLFFSLPLSLYIYTSVLFLLLICMRRDATISFLCQMLFLFFPINPFRWWFRIYSFFPIYIRCLYTCCYTSDLYACPTWMYLLYLCVCTIYN